MERTLLVCVVVCLLSAMAAVITPHTVGSDSSATGLETTHSGAPPR